jgi:hypothetical protein
VALTLIKPSPTARLTLSARSPPPPTSLRTERSDLYTSSRDGGETMPAEVNSEKNCSWGIVQHGSFQ